MLETQPNWFALVLLCIQAVLYLPVVRRALQRRVGQEKAALLVGLYAVTAFALQVFEALQRAGLLPTVPAYLTDRIQWYGTFVLAFLLIFLVRAFLRLQGGKGWLWVGGFWLLLLVVTRSNLLHLPATLWANDQFMLPSENLDFGVVLIGWMIFLAAPILTTQRAFRHTPQPMHRNRLAYWLPIFILITTNDSLLLTGYVGWGNPLRLLTAHLMAYVMLNHHLPDIRQIVQKVFVFLASAMLCSLFCLGGFFLLEDALTTAPNYNPRLVQTGVALVTGLLFTLLLGPVQRLISRLFPAEQYNIGETLREYSLSISNILDMERLATMAVGLIMEAMEIERGFLFLVDAETGQDGQKIYHLRAIRSPGERPIRAGKLTESSPLVQAILQDKRPILQYDIDLAPAFSNLSTQEREWFNALRAEVYAPIFAKGVWIGLLVLGAKLSGNRYTETDLVTLSTLANQTAVALENARLVENLVRLNQELRQAGRALDQAHRNLERLDRTKSDFISIASHELRTPLTVMRGYTEMLLEDEQIQKNPYHLQMIKSLHEGTLRLHEIMDSMFDIAEIDTRNLRLHIQPVDVGELIRGVSSGLGKNISERKQKLFIDLPALPLVMADPNILRKVFFHLVQNAIKFTPDGGRIGIHGRVVMPRNDFPDGGIEIVVSDTGVGVDPNFREIIFTKFYQTDESLNKHSTSKSRFKGSGAGLGLALSRGIVEAHGGKIWVESPGYDEINFPGSHFHVLLPLRRLQNGETVRMGSALKVTI
jgi:signal transduction histidine kinase